MLAGGNGAGKTTFYQTRLAHTGLPFVNADNIAQAENVDSYEAARIAEQQRTRYLKDGISFCFETVFSHPSKIDFIAHALALDYRIHLIVIHLDDPALHAARVTQRVGEGGHPVPPDKIVERIPRTLRNISQAIPLCHEVLALDNSNDTDPYRPVFRVRDGLAQAHTSPLPDWAEEMLEPIVGPGAE